MKRIQPGMLILAVIILTSALSACDELPAPQKYALNGTSTKTPFQLKSTYTPTKEPPPTFTPSDTPSITPSPTLTATATETAVVSETAVPDTPSPVPVDSATPGTQKRETNDQATVRVSVTTNCRSGPGISYPKLSPLQAGKTAILLGRDKTSTYWIIKDPGSTGRECWLWGYYATTAGNTTNLPVYSNPVQPAPAASKTLAPTTQATTPAFTRTPKPSATPKTPLPSNTPNLTPATITNTPLPATATPIPSETPLPSDTPVPSDTPLPSSTPLSPYCPYTSVLAGEEQQIMNLINNARTSRGLPALTVKTSLVNAARDHGRDMTCNGVYSHTSTDGTLAWERIGIYTKNNRSWCYSNCCCGEIFYGGGSYLTPQQAFNWWMNHESQDPDYTDNIHKRTILGQYYTRIGVGVIYYEHNGVIRKFYTVDFVRQ